MIAKKFSLGMGEKRCNLMQVCSEVYTSSSCKLRRDNLYSITVLSQQEKSENVLTMLRMTAS